MTPKQPPCRGESCVYFALAPTSWAVASDPSGAQRLPKVTLPEVEAVGGAVPPWGHRTQWWLGTEPQPSGAALPGL